MKKLTPCPICSNIPEVQQETSRCVQLGTSDPYNGAITYSVECCDDDLFVNSYTKEGAIKAWNRIIKRSFPKSVYTPPKPSIQKMTTCPICFNPEPTVLRSICSKSSIWATTYNVKCGNHLMSGIFHTEALAIIAWNRLVKTLLPELTKSPRQYLDDLLGQTYSHDNLGYSEDVPNPKQRSYGELTEKSLDKVIRLIKDQNSKANELYKLGVDISELNDNLHLVIDILLDSTFSKEKAETLSWYIYEEPDPPCIYKSDCDTVLYDFRNKGDLWRYLNE